MDNVNNSLKALASYGADENNKLTLTYDKKKNSVVAKTISIATKCFEAIKSACGLNNKSNITILNKLDLILTTENLKNEKIAERIQAAEGLKKLSYFLPYDNLTLGRIEAIRNRLLAEEEKKEERTETKAQPPQQPDTAQKAEPSEIKPKLKTNREYISQFMEMLNSNAKNLDKESREIILKYLYPNGLPHAGIYDFRFATKSSDEFTMEVWPNHMHQAYHQEVVSSHDFRIILAVKEIVDRHEELKPLLDRINQKKQAN